MAEKNQRRATPSPAAGERAAACPIVGIGASAGGLEALEKFFDAMPADSGLAFVVIQHLDPTRESHMVELLGRHTRMDVVSVKEGAKVQPNCVYMILPNREVTIRAGMLHLAEPSERRSARRPVDAFLTSLAEDQSERAIGIILSGTGSNGTSGIRAIKGGGGLVLAQQPETAQHPGMPRSAIASGMVDLVLAPEAMPEALLRYVRHFYVALGDERAKPGREIDAEVNRILAFLRTRSGHEFGAYKRNMVLRRIHRRMGLKSIERFIDYEDALRGSPDEVAALVKDLMIGVTGFFRDPQAWEELSAKVIEPLVRERQTGDPIRIWTPACATGEEAYSLAILIAEVAEAAQKSFDVKMFATDSAGDSLSAARRGLFPGTIEQDVSSERLRRFFDPVGESFEIRKDLRDWLVFAPQNLLQDPPFSRVDLVTCRNLLIYLEDEAQQKALALLHFALREGGHLFLGSAETVGRHPDLFETVSKKWRIYRRIGGTRHDLVEFPVAGRQGVGRMVDLHAALDVFAGPKVADAAQRALAEQFAPASVLIDRGHRIVYFHGPTDRFLMQPPGEPTRDLYGMAREGLRAKLRVAVQKAVRHDQRVAVPASIRLGTSPTPMTISVTPLHGAGAENLLLVSFEEGRAGADRAAGRAPAANSGLADGEFEAELGRVRDELSQTIGDLETSNEELKASNEEITSINEELQSANEELETSKEELQSLNEELNTVNNQLQRKVEELEAKTNDLGNLLTSTDIATVFLDRHFQIRWFTPAINRLVGIIQNDIGRPITHFAPRFHDPELLRDAQTVLDQLAPVQAEVAGDDGRWYLRRIVPYRTQDNRIDGVVVTFSDITEIKAAGAAVHAARDQIMQIYNSVPHPLVVLDPELKVSSANEMFYQTFQVQRGETEGRAIYDLGNRQWDVRPLRQLLAEVISKRVPLEDFVVEHEFEQLGARTMLLQARQVRDADLVLLSIQDITEQKRWEEHQKLLVSELSHRVKNTLATVQSIAAQTIRHSKSLESFYQDFSGRLQALGGAHALLTARSWQSLDVRAVILEPLRAYATDTGRVRLEGPEIELKPGAALALSLVVHELATNAVKHGALSNQAGGVAIAWELTGAAGERRLRFVWRESGGPKVRGATARGFGLSLIERITGYELDGEIRYDFAPEGFVCDLVLAYNGDNFRIPAERAGRAAGLA